MTGIWRRSRLSIGPSPKGLTGLTFEERLANGVFSRQERSNFGACMRCQMLWDRVEGHTTYYSTGGCFPLCEECWSELTPEQRLPYYAALWKEWQLHAQQAGITDHDHPSEVWEIIKANVLAGK